jgi:ribosomal protein S18 acetylase RimI-like enzyme
MDETPLALTPPDPKVSIRPVRLTDATSLRATCWPERSFDTVYRFITRARQNAAQGRGLGIVAVGNAGMIQGYGQFTLWPRCGEISDLIVTPTCRGRGIGTAMIQYLARSAREMSAECIEIGALTSNTGAIALYRRLGFIDSHMQTIANDTDPILYLRIKLRR